MSNHGCCADKTCTPETCMELPEGTTCGGCYAFEHCRAFYGHTPEDTYCDFFPRRFHPGKARCRGCRAVLEPGHPAWCGGLCHAKATRVECR